MTYIDKIKQGIKYFDALRSVDEEEHMKTIESCLVLMHKRLNTGFSNKRLLA